MVYKTCKKLGVILKPKICIKSDSHNTVVSKVLKEQWQQQHFFFFFFFFFFWWGEGRKRNFLWGKEVKKKLCWNHQIWYNFNTFEITLGGKLGAREYFGRKCPNPHPNQLCKSCHNTTFSRPVPITEFVYNKKIYIIFISNCPKDSKKWYIFINHCPKGWQEMRWCNYNNFESSAMTSEVLVVSVANATIYPPNWATSKSLLGKIQDA